MLRRNQVWARAASAAVVLSALSWASGARAEDGATAGGAVAAGEESAGGAAPGEAASAEGGELPWTARLVRGTSPGEPGAAKIATVATLYTAAAASLAGGVVFTFSGLSAGGDADDFADAQQDDFCADRSSDACTRYLRLRRDESDKLLLGEALLGGSALLLLSGALTAELWENEVAVQVSADVRPGQAFVGFSAAF